MTDKETIIRIKENCRDSAMRAYDVIDNLESPEYQYATWSGIRMLALEILTIIAEGRK